MSVNLISITKYKNDNIPYFAVFMTVVEDSTIHGSFFLSHWFDTVVSCKYMTEFFVLTAAYKCAAK